MQRTSILGCTVGLTVCVVLAAPVGCSSPADGTGGGSGQGGSTGAGGTTAGSGGVGVGSGGTTTGQGGAAGSAVVGAMEYWISPTGSDTALGTMAAPFKTLARALNLTRPGTTVWVMPGTYPMTATVRMTSAAGPTAPIRIWASGARPVFDFATQARGSRGFEMSGYYYHLKGLELANAGDNCILLSGSNNTIENVVTHHCEDTGIQITVSSDQATNDLLGANNLILNCDSYGNFDMATNGENADGFAAKLRIGPGNIFRGCRAWNNADDGYDLFAADDVVVIDRCWAFLNGIRVAGDGNTAGDGNGFKLGGAPAGPGEGGAVHMVTGDASFENRTCGFTRNNNPDVPALSNCAVNGNRNDYCDISCSSPHAVTMTGAAAKALPRSADGSLPTL